MRTKPTSTTCANSYGTPPVAWRRATVPYSTCIFARDCRVKSWAAALGVKEHHATVLLGRVREHVDRSLGALLVARTGRRDCRELDELLSGWDGSLSPLLRKRVARHIDNCEVCGERRRMVSPAALLAGVPILPAPGYLRDRVLEDVALASSSSADGQYLTTRVQHWAPLVAAAVVAALIVAGAAFFALRPTTAPVSATGSGPSLTLAAAPSASATPGTHRHCPFAWADSYCYCCDPGGCAGRHRVAHRRDRLRGYVNGSVAAVPQHRWQRTLVDAFVAGCSHCSFCRVGFAGQRRSCQRRPDSRSGRAH